MIRDLLPPKVRQAIYSVLGVAIALEAIFDVVDGDWEGKILAALSVLGFTMAAGNVTKKADV